MSEYEHLDKELNELYELIRQEGADNAARSERVKSLVRESPITEGVLGLLRDTSQAVLQGQGTITTSFNFKDPVNTIYELGWAGKTITRMIMPPELEEVRVLPFGLAVGLFRDSEDGSLGFRVTANYDGVWKGDEERAAIAQTKSINMQELGSILRTQGPMIKETASK